MIPTLDHIVKKNTLVINVNALNFRFMGVSMRILIFPIPSVVHFIFYID